MKTHTPPSTLALHCAFAGQLDPAGGVPHPDSLEGAIDTVWLVLCSAKTPEDRRTAMIELNSLVKQRSEERVRQMEIEQGLRSS